MAHGTFCWHELAAHDTAKARAFYTELFDWGVSEHDLQLPGIDIYSFFVAGKREQAGMFRLNPLRFEGVPAHWTPYIRVENVDASSSAAEKAGGAVLVPPRDIIDIGRIARIQDPSGGVFVLFQDDRVGRIPGTPARFGRTCWNELATRDPEAAAAFYSELFGWSTRRSIHGGVAYTNLMLGDQPVGGMVNLPETAIEPSAWLMYVEVEDADAAAHRVEELGGRLIAGPRVLENVGRLAKLEDPELATFAVIELSPRP